MEGRRSAANDLCHVHRPTAGTRRPVPHRGAKTCCRRAQYLIADMKMADISRAKEESETTGLIRIIVDGDSEAILGAGVRHRGR